MCRHIWKTINGLRVCPKCGMTVLHDGRVMRDKALPGYLQQKGKGKQ